ncbi:MAG TPA: shikimate dehydrogenase [Bacteroidetes bacterium]|nr:shikimate dehydrogenase [Bacteroidota bacterium]
MTGLAVLLGVPVTHSLSPALHNAAFREHGIPAAYVACDVPPDRLAEAVHGLDALGAMGANVTIPHKQAVQAHCAAIAPEAAVVGAVNTLVRGEAGWIGHNTDVAGFLTPLADHALDGAEVTVLGAGGAARAVVYGLLSAFSPSRITIASRRPEQADALAEAFAAHDTAGALAVAAMEDAPAADLVVNATPLGMTGREDHTPYPRADLGPGQTAYDLVYRPRETRFLREAAANGAQTIGGLPMLIGQAAAAFELWTGRPFPTETARRAALDAFAP